MTAQTSPRRTTSIEWTEHTWNPFVGCSVKTAGCTNCYAMKLAVRLEAFGQTAYAGTTHRGAWTGRINRASDATMRKPLGIRGPALFFVNSMSDFWHEGADDGWRREALAIIAATPWHTYQILTKRPENVAPMLERLGIELPDNVWLGATVEDHRVADRVGMLRAVPAAIRFLSVEPMIGPLGTIDLIDVHWVITGGESGPGARLCRAEWVREVRDQCQAQDVAYFHKQWGAYRSNPLVTEDRFSIEEAQIHDPKTNGKGGALLDGRLWREMPVAP